MRRLATLTLVIVLCAAPAAAADGLPVAFDAANNAGIAEPGGAFSYATASAGGNTAVLKIARGTGEIQRSANLAGDWGVPLVAYDGSPSGLSGDGRTLVLIRPRVRFPREQTSFAIFDTERLHVRKFVELEGDFSFDALSPDGRTMYLIRYSDPGDPTAYEVRAYDLERRRLVPGAIVDPREPDESMAGFPQTRAVGPGGRWAYTLYSSAEHHHPPFIHALDTARGTAVCIDLDLLADRGGLDRMSLQPAPDGSDLHVVMGGEPLARVDLASFEVSPPAPGEEPAVEGDDGDPIGWAVLALGAGLGGAGALTLTMVRRRRARRVFDEELSRS